MRAFTDPKGPPIGETTFLVEDYVPDRIEFDLATKAASIAKGAPVEFTVDGRYLYGAPAADLDLEGEVKVKAAERAARLCRLSVRHAGRRGRRRGDAATQQPLEDLPTTDDKGKAKFTVALDKLPDATQPLEAQVIVRMAEEGGRAVERKLDAAGASGRPR